MKKTKSFIIYVAVVLLIGAISCAALLIANRMREEKYGYSFSEQRHSGVIYGYLEPEDSEQIQVYIILVDDTFANRFAIYAIPKEYYNYLPDEIKTVIDNRETGAFLRIAIAYNKVQHERLGYDCIKQVLEYKLDWDLERIVQDIDLSWME